MAELWFYHLERITAESLLPQLLRRGGALGLRLAVQTISQERAAFWSDLLWSQEDTGFLAHGLASGDRAAQQPICLTVTAENPNGSVYRFYVDGALPELAPHEAALTRRSVLFDGRSEKSVAEARDLWRRARLAGTAVRYQQQGEDGGWTEIAGLKQTSAPGGEQDREAQRR